MDNFTLEAVRHYDVDDLAVDGLVLVGMTREETDLIERLMVGAVRLYVVQHLHDLVPAILTSAIS